MKQIPFRERERPRKRAFCRSSDLNVQAPLGKRQRAVLAFSPPRYRTSMTRFRGAGLRRQSRRFVLTATNQTSVWPVSGTFTRFPCSARNKNTCPIWFSANRVAYLPQKPKRFSFVCCHYNSNHASPSSPILSAMRFWHNQKDWHYPSPVGGKVARRKP